MDSLHQVEINATPAAIYGALTEKAGISSWWSEHAKAEATVGFLNQVSFYGGMVEFELRNETLAPGEEVVWAVEGGPPPWVGTKICWSITPGAGPSAGKMVLNFAHRGLELPEDVFASINYNWGWYLTSLKFYLERGAGMPHTDADMAA